MSTLSKLRFTTDLPTSLYGLILSCANVRTALAAEPNSPFPYRKLYPNTKAIDLEHRTKLLNKVKIVDARSDPGHQSFRIKFAALPLENLLAVCCTLLNTNVWPTTVS